MLPSFSEPVDAAEVPAFKKLQARLPEIWERIQCQPDYAHTSVVVPSLSADQDELDKIEGVSFYEERLLFSIIRLRNAATRVLYVTSQPVHPDIVDYYLQLLVGVPASHARRRLQLFCVHDASREPLTRKILRRPRMIRRIREWIEDPDKAYLTCFNSTALERKLAVALGIPLNGVDPDDLSWGTKSGSREIFSAANVRHPSGFRDLRTEEQIVDALVRLCRQSSQIRRAVVKLNASFSGEGNATFTFPASLPHDDDGRRRRITEQLGHLEWTAAKESRQRYMSKFREMGGVVEELVEAPELRSPSVQMRICPGGSIQVVSTHEQVLGGSTGQVYLGCRFPACDEYRGIIQRETLKIAGELRKRGVVGRFGVDFLVAREAGSEWNALAIEINLRMGGTTHPFLALEFLTGGSLDAQDGRFISRSGDHKYYFSTDNLKSPSYRGLLAEDLMDILVQNGLQFRPATETGVLFHMIGALSQYGKVGVTCIGDSPEEADELYRCVVATLDRETGAEESRGGRAFSLLDRSVRTME